MKRLDLVQLTIIIIGLFSGFFFINLVPQFIVYMTTWFGDGLRGGYFMESFIENILIMAMYLLIALYAIKNSKHFAEWICNKANLDARVDFSLDKADLLFVLFIGLGLYGLIKNLPPLLVRLFNRIKDNNSFPIDDQSHPFSTSEMVSQSLIVLCFFVLVYYAKTFSDFFAGKINNVEPEDEITTNT